MIHRFLLPGEYVIAKEPMIIETLVGSCVSVCLYNAKNGLSAMNHFLRDRPGSEKAVDIGQYASASTEHIINALLVIDGTVGHYRAHIFGGAAVIKTTHSDSDIGRKNVEAALEVLRAHRIRVVEEAVGGTRGRRIRFNTQTGRVEHRFAGQIRRKKQLSRKNAE